MFLNKLTNRKKTLPNPTTTRASTTTPTSTVTNDGPLIDYNRSGPTEVSTYPPLYSKQPLDSRYPTTHSPSLGRSRNKSPKLSKGDSGHQHLSKFFVENPEGQEDTVLLSLPSQSPLSASFSSLNRTNGLDLSDELTPATSIVGDNRSLRESISSSDSRSRDHPKNLATATDWQHPSMPTPAPTKPRPQPYAHPLGQEFRARKGSDQLTNSLSSSSNQSSGSIASSRSTSLSSSYEPSSASSSSPTRSTPTTATITPTGIIQPFSTSPPEMNPSQRSGMTYHRHHPTVAPPSEPGVSGGGHPNRSDPDRLDPRAPSMATEGRISTSSNSSCHSYPFLILPPAGPTTASNRSVNHTPPAEPLTGRPEGILDPEIPIRQRASSYHNTTPAVIPALSQSPPTADLAKRPTSLFSSHSSSKASLSSPPHADLNDCTPKSKKSRRPKARKSKTDSRKPLSTHPAAPGIAGALAMSGVSLVAHPSPLQLAGNMQQVNTSTYGAVRSPDEKDDRSVHTTDSVNWAKTVSSLDDQLGTGYAVASKKRNVEFHTIFKSIPEDDYLIEDYGCALQRDILVQGRLYISEQHLCFNANIFGWVTSLVVPFSDVSAIEKRMTALIIPNAIQVITTQSRHTFTSFLSRDSTYDLMNSIWRIALPTGTAPLLSLDLKATSTDRSIDGAMDSPSSRLSHSSTSAPTKKIDHAVTQCDCSVDEHYKEIIWDATYPISPEKLYNILFQSDFLKDFWVNEEHLTEIDVGDWITAPDAKYPSRFLSYIRPVNAPVGPKSIKCLVSDEHRALDFDRYVSILSTAKTPDAPAGGSFCVKTLTCITWGPNNSSRWLVTAGVEWSKVNRFLKSIIESSAIGGQKTYQAAVDQALRKHLAQLEPNSERPEIAAGSNASQYVGTGQHTVVADSSVAKPVQSLLTNVCHVPQLSAQHPITRKSPIGHHVTILGTQISWMMAGSIALVIVLIIWNLMLILWHDTHVVEVHSTGGPGHQHIAYQGVKHELTRDVAETVKEALKEYFSDHPILPRVDFDRSKFTMKEEGSGSEGGGSKNGDAPLGFGPARPERSSEPDLIKEISANEEMKEIELMLEYLEMRIRNVRKSLVNDRNKDSNPSP